LSTTALTVRIATSKDLPAILRLEKESALAAHWSVRGYQAIFDCTSPERICLVGDVQGELGAFLVARFEPDICELENIVVATRDRGRGIASQLLEQLIAVARARQIKQLLLEVRESNVAARALYGKFGFQQNGCRENYYGNPTENAILYALSL
jgi:[ribosomal protein S18]-alanine N-acetyltransferase